jgi:hypothetical protein
MSSDEWARELTLMQACWVFFDQVRSRVSAEMQRAREGEGVTGTESSVMWSTLSRTGRRSSGLLTPHGAMLTGMD